MANEVCSGAQDDAVDSRISRSLPRGRLFRQTMLAWAAVFAIVTLWSFATPLWSSPDEPAHALNAYSVANGNLYPERTTEKTGTGVSNAAMPIPAGLLDSASSIGCYAFHPNSSAACIAAPTNDPAEKRYVNPAGRYMPAYYFVSGAPSLLVPIADAPRAMRAASTLIATLFIAWGITAAMSYRRRSIAVTGVLVCLTPMVLYLSGVVNPNSLEICASIAMCASTMAFLREPETWLGQVMFRRAMISASAMVMTRTLSPIWLAVWFLAFAALANRDVWREFLTFRKLKWVLLAVMCTCASLVWTLLSGVTQYQLKPQFSFSFDLRLFLSQQFIDLVTWPQEIGTFGWGDTHLADGTINMYLYASLAIVVVAWTYLRLRGALVVVGLALIQYFLPIYLHAYQWNDNGAVWQGRYSLPLTVMVPITCLFLAANRIEVTPRSATTRHIYWFFPASLALLAFVHINAILAQFRRNIGGVKSKSVFGGPWEPPLPAQLIFVLFLLGIAGVTLWVAYLYLIEARADRQRDRMDQPISNLAVSSVGAPDRSNPSEPRGSTEPTSDSYEAPESTDRTDTRHSGGAKNQSANPSPART